MSDRGEWIENVSFGFMVLILFTCGALAIGMIVFMIAREFGVLRMLVGVGALIALTPVAAYIGKKMLP
jgi:hypothetical protein